jgi:DNA-binding PadR family transcriptional regulator
VQEADPKAESGRQRKYYRLTKSGEEELASQRRQWQVVDSTLRRTLFRSSLLVPQGG